MDTLAEMVKSVVIIVLLAGFAEMLLPGEEMGRYVQLVMGLFVIVAILTPVLGLLRREGEFEVMAWQLPARPVAAWEEVRREGEEIARRQEEVALREYTSRLAGQVEALARLVPGVAWAEAVVSVREGKGPSAGALERVNLTVGLGSAAGEPPGSAAGAAQIPPGGPVAPVRIRPPAEPPPGPGGPPPPAGGAGVEARVRETIRDFYGLQPEQINVQVVAAAGGEEEQ